MDGELYPGQQALISPPLLYPRDVTTLFELPVLIESLDYGHCTSRA